MGAKISSLFSRFSKRKNLRILMIGLEGAGKTTILYQMKLHEHMESIPTIGFNVETFYYKNIAITCWDISGGERIRPLWHHYFENTDGVIFVVDSNDRQRIEEAKEELHRASNDTNLENVSFLILSNKNDLPNAMSNSELIDKLDLYMIRGKNWYIQNSCALTGEGLCEGFNWLSDEILSQIY
ncbi:unnamed protein product [Blepharisma stoltei]|uniref:ADP-ribosylation factor n=1 Tax=Blepharisma stoltei TaxID=1481888 RepID=A0AAU9IEP0_9CILI|nr:unnamed protein product [Blepharisma stoltei]